MSKRSDQAVEIIALASQKFNRLTIAEKSLLESAVTGNPCDLRSSKKGENDLATAKDWGMERALRSELLAWLITEATDFVAYKGISLIGGRIDGVLNLVYAVVPFALYFEKCIFVGEIQLGGARLQAIKLPGSHLLGSLSLDSSRVDGNVYLTDGLCSYGTLNLVSARIGGTVDLSHGTFQGGNAHAILADGLKVEQTLFMNNDFCAHGAVHLVGATISGHWNCIGGSFYNQGGYALFADEIEVGGLVHMRNGFHSKGPVSLHGARFGSNFLCQEATFENSKGIALLAEGIDVRGSVVFCDGFHAIGSVRLMSAKIGSSLDCSNAELEGDGKHALVAGRMIVGGGASFKDVHAAGEVHLSGSRFDGQLQLTEGNFVNADGVAINLGSVKTTGVSGARTSITGELHMSGLLASGELNLSESRIVGYDGSAIEAERISVKGHAHFNDAVVSGVVNLAGSQIAGTLNCIRARFQNESGVALNAESLEIGESVSLSDKFIGLGEVTFAGAKIQGDVRCSSSRFHADSGTALNFEDCVISGSLFARNGAEIVGGVRLHRTRIDGNLECDGSRFENPSGQAIAAESLQLGGNVFLRNGFRSQGAVRFVNAKIAGDLVCAEASFNDHKADAISIEGAYVGGRVFLCNGLAVDGSVNLHDSTIKKFLTWRRIESPEKVSLDLRSANIGVLRMNPDSWPSAGNLNLDGLVYHDIYNVSRQDVNSLLAWLERQGNAEFRPQPFEQLASVLMRTGREDDARYVLVAKGKSREKHLRGTALWTHKLLGLLIGYGYRPWRALWTGFGIVVFGWSVTAMGWQADVVSATHADAYLTVDSRRTIDTYPVFSPLVYSMDMFIPVVNLRQAEYWTPDANRNGRIEFVGISVPYSGSILRVYMWLHTLAGWVFTTLLIVGVSGLVRR